MPTDGLPRSVSNRFIRSPRQQVADQLRQDLLCGRLTAGSRLSEVKLAKRFGISRGMVREVFAQLTHEGLLVAKPNCGVSVAQPPSDAIRDFVVPIRRAAEAYALRLVFEKLDQRDFHTWEEIVFRMERACRDSDEESIVLTDIEFHRFLIERAGDPDLSAIWHTILIRIRGHFREETHRMRRRLDAIYRVHQQLLESFRSGDKKAAIKKLEAHIW